MINIPSPSVAKRSAFLGAVFALPLLGAITAEAAPITIISDDWSSYEVGTPTSAIDPTVKWAIKSGSFAADGSSVGNVSPEAGSLNFGTASGTSIEIDLRPVEVGTPVTVSFSLRQKNGASGNYAFSFGFRNEAEGKSYMENATLNSGFYGGTSGFHSYDSTGLLIAGAEGFYLNTNGAPQTLSITFDPNLGVTVTKDEIVVAQWNNFHGLDSVDKFTLTSSGVVSWFVDDFEVVATVPEPHAVAVLGGAGLFLGLARLRKRLLSGRNLNRD